MRCFRVRDTVAAAAMCVVMTAAAHAQAWPTRSIRVISPYPPGSASDTTGRVVLDQVSKFLGQAIVVEPQLGAGGVVGFATVARAGPDG